MKKKFSKTTLLMLTLVFGGLILGGVAVADDSQDKPDLVVQNLQIISWESSNFKFSYTLKNLGPGDIGIPNKPSSFYPKVRIVAQVKINNVWHTIFRGFRQHYIPSGWEYTATQGPSWIEAPNGPTIIDQAVINEQLALANKLRMIVDPIDEGLTGAGFYATPNLVPETDDYNNIAEVVLPKPAPPALPDVTVTGCGVVDWATTPKITFWLKNLGDAAAPNVDYRVSFYLGSPYNMWKVSRFGVYVNLAQGYQFKHKFSIMNLTQDQIAHIEKIKVEVDYKAPFIEEANEDNNVCEAALVPPGSRDRGREGTQRDQDRGGKGR
jgi:hypothetical protein